MQIPSLTLMSPDALTNAMALELVAQLEPATVIFARYGYTNAEATKLLGTPAFQQLLREARLLWESNDNQDERIRKKAAMIVEDGLLRMSVLLNDKEKPAAVQADIFKTLSRLAGVERSNDNAVPGSGFRIVMNFGFQDSPQVIEGSSHKVDGDEDDAPAITLSMPE